MANENLINQLREEYLDPDKSAESVEEQDISAAEKFSLAPCEYCGEINDIELVKVGGAFIGKPQGFVAECANCGAATKEYTTADEAKAAWNNQDLEYYGDTPLKEMQDLKPCKYCGNENPEFVEGKNNLFSIKCPECGTHTAQNKDPAVVYSAWQYFDDVTK